MSRRVSMAKLALARQLNQEVAEIMNEAADKLKDVAKRADAGGVPVHIVCRTWGQVHNAQHFFHGFCNMIIGWILEKTPEGTVRMKYSTLVPNIME